MVQKSSVHTCQTCQIKCYGTLNIQLIYQWFRNHWFAHGKHAKQNVIAIQTYTLYPVVLKGSVCTCQTCQIKLVGVGHCFAWQITCPSRLVTSYLCRPLPQIRKLVWYWYDRVESINGCQADVQLSWYVNVGNH